MSDLPIGPRPRLRPPPASRPIEAFEGLAEQLPLAPDALYQMTPVRDELGTNIISYGGIGPSGRPIRVEFKAANGMLETVIPDPGRPFDPRSAPAPDTDQALGGRKIGLGGQLVRDLDDSFEDRYEAGHDRVTLRTRLTGAAP